MCIHIYMYIYNDKQSYTYGMIIFLCIYFEKGAFGDVMVSKVD